MTLSHKDIVVRLAVADAALWVASAKSSAGRFSSRTIGGATSRILLVVDEPEAVLNQAVGAIEASPVVDEHPYDDRLPDGACGKIAA